jgi:hypothetical protein
VISGSSGATGVATLLAVLLTAPGCGDDEEPAGSSRSPSPTTGTGGAEAPAPVEAYQSWMSALAEHDAVGACRRHAPELTIELRQRAILEKRASPGDPCVAFVALLWEDPAREYDAEEIQATQVGEEDALLAVDFPRVDQTVTMTYWHGGWRVADTSPRASADGDGSRWVGAWCDLAVGMDRRQVVDRMGTPSGEYTVTNGGEPQLWWADRQYDFRAYLDPEGRVLDLVGDYDRLGAADRRVLTCPELR